MNFQKVKININLEDEIFLTLLVCTFLAKTMILLEIIKLGIESWGYGRCIGNLQP
jgi:hypothetical protein